MSIKTSPIPEDFSPSAARTIAVWDLPLRVFHWLLAALVVTAGITGKMGGDAMELHQQAGYGIAILVIFRLIWGCLGSAHARFGNFVRGLPTIVAYCRDLVRGEIRAQPGHNPLGGWMVVVMLAVLVLQSATGLFANDDIMAEGPLFSLVSKDTSDYLTALHKLNFKALLGLVSLHVLAIGLYLAVKRINLVRPMITGRMAVNDPSPQQQAIPGYINGLALALLLLVGAGFYLLVLC